MSRISSRTSGSATRILLTKSRVTGVKFFGNIMRPELAISTIKFGGIAEYAPDACGLDNWSAPISIALGPNGVKPPSISQIKIPKLHISAL